MSIKQTEIASATKCGGVKRKPAEMSIFYKDEKEYLFPLTSKIAHALQPTKTETNKKRKLSVQEAQSNIPHQPAKIKYKSSKANLTNTTDKKQKVIQPFWSEHTKTESKKWWVPTKNNCVELDSKSWNGHAKNLSGKSWYTTKTFQPHEKITPIPSLPTITKLQSATEEKETKQWKTCLIRMLPTTEQKQTLTRWIGTVRWTYNQCLDAFNKKQVLINGQLTKTEMSKKFFRSWCIKQNSELFQNNPWLAKTPFDVRDEAMNDFIKAYFSTTALLRTGTIKKFKMKFRKKKEGDESMVVLKKHWKNNTWFKTFLGADVLKTTEPVPDTLFADSRMIKTKSGKYYLCLLKPLEVKTESQGPAARVLVLDPGVRTFMTGYDPSGFVYEWGAKDMNRIYRLQLTIDLLQSKMSSKTIKHKKRYRIKRAVVRIHEKIKNLINEIHRKCVKWMVDNFTLILLPLFETSKMVIRTKRKISTTTTRQMLTWSHYKFRQLLLSKVREHKWCKVTICDESYTSKTCGQCGKIHNKLGGNKSFKCPDCDYESDRDHNAARNIWLKYLTEKNISSDAEVVKH